MNKKGFANIALIVLVFLFAGVAGYFALVRKPSLKNIQTQQPVPSPVVNNAPSSKKLRVVVILFGPASTSEKLYTKQQVQDEMFTSTNSVKNFFEEGSFHRWSLDGDVLGEYIIPDSGNGSCQYVQWSDQALVLVKNSGVNLDNYTNFVFVFPMKESGCTFGGWHNMGGNKFWVMNPATNIFIHELGHAFGLAHANAWLCGDKSIDQPSSYTPPSSIPTSTPSSSCKNLEYGDPADVMGGYGGYGTDVQLFNAPHMVALDWIPFGNIKKVTTSGTYAISNLETSTDQTQVIEIGRPNTNQTYYLEYRQPIGTFDHNLGVGLTNGVLIHVWDGQYETKLIDTTPENCTVSPIPSQNTCQGYQFNNAALSDGNSFSDAMNGITIRQVSHSDKSAILDIKFTK